jgi:hypothetical protein
VLECEGNELDYPCEVASNHQQPNSPDFQREIYFEDDSKLEPSNAQEPLTMVIEADSPQH